MQVVVVSSPGSGGQPHWSHEQAAAFARAAVARSAWVRWLVALHAGQPVPAAERGLQVFPCRERAHLRLDQVQKSLVDAPLERALTECLREQPLSAVVHFGLGGHGSPNLLWLADRLGSPTFAVVRGRELVCHRGDLFDRDRRVCTRWHDAGRCRWCCTTSWRRRPRSLDLVNRTDLCIASLQTCASVHVAADEDVPFVTGLGIARERVVVGASTDDLAAHVAAALRPAR
ncbi:MAG TPA: hypothetical protein ENI87_03490 [bacterium]|nr:hypothetical protein [bacterium]